MAKSHRRAGGQMTREAPTTIPSGVDYREAEEIARRLSDLDLLTLARRLSSDQCHAPEMAANHEVNRRFERLRERFLVLNKSLESANEKHHVLQERFDKMLTVLQRVLGLLAGPEARPAGSPPPVTTGAQPDTPGERSSLAG
jgi:hypothetical protein